MTTSSVSPSASPPPPRVAFCFHSPEAGGACVWLRDFLLTGGYPPGHCLAILPAESSMTASLEAAGIATHTLAGRMGALSKASARERMHLLRNRIAMVSMYRRVFRSEGVDLVYVNSSTQIAPMIAARLERRPLVVHVHETLFSGRTHWIKRLAVQRLAHAAVFAARLGLRVFSPPPPGAVWETSPNGVDLRLADARAARDDIRRELGLEDRMTMILFLGSLCEGKGLHDLIDCWPRLYRDNPGLRLYVAGSPDPQDRNPAIRRFVDFPPAGASHLGYRKDAARLMAAADLLVLPSYDEAMPMVVCEAMMAGTPVVARGVGDIPWQIGEGRGFLFEGRGPEPLERALREALADPGEALRRAAKAQEFAREHLTRNQQQEQIRRIIDWTWRHRR